MSTCSTHRPSLSVVTLLHQALRAADRSLTGASLTVPLLLSLRRRSPTGVELAALPLAAGAHPVEVLTGFTAPVSWQAVGCLADGTVCRLDREPAATNPSVGERLGFLLHRSANSAATLSGRPLRPRPGDASEPGGRLADVCRRVLQLPTPAAEQGPEAWWAMVWLDRLFAEAVLDPAGRFGWADAVALHPFYGIGDPGRAAGRSHGRPSPGAAFAASITDAASTLSWDTIRAAVAGGSETVNHVGPDEAAWFDSGSFARAVMEPYLSVPFVLKELRALLPESTHAETTAALCGWGLV